MAGQLLGHRCIGAVEIDPYCRAVIAARQADGTFPQFPVFTDIRTFDARPYAGRADIVAGGFPCQCFSTAARGRNVADDLWPEMLRVVADVAPRYVFAENVSKGAIALAAYQLEQMGYETRCAALAARDLGADHVRSRYWVLAHADDESQFRRDEHAEVASLPFIRHRVWSTEPDCLRVPDGLADRMDRYRAAGNGQVPVVAATAFALLAAEFD